MSQISLIGGELDGLLVKITADRPDIFYAVPSNAEQLIRETIGTKAKAELRQKFSVIAYRFTDAVKKTGVGLEYRYSRAPELDLVPPSPDKIA